MSQPDFTVDVAQNEYLREGGDDVNAIVTVTSPDTASPATCPAAPAADRDPGIAAIIIIDCSGSMRSPQTKMAEAPAAPTVALGVIRDRTAVARTPSTDR